MNRPLKCLVTLSAVLLVSGCGKPQKAAPISAAPQLSKVQHNPGEEFTAWVICIDTSRSPLRDEFGKLKGVIRESIETDIDFNDLVWIVRIGDQFHPASSFQMPARGRTRSERERSAVQLREAKQDVLKEVEGLQQVAGMTDLRNPIGLALNILVNQRAKRKFLVIGSDFVQDGNGIITSAPPKSTEGLSAKDVNVTLLLTYPDAKYLKTLGISETELLRGLREQWTEYFKGLGAVKIVAELIDAVPDAREGNTGR